MNTEQRQRIEALYLEMFNVLKIIARSKLGSDGLAEEAVQETFRIACQKPDALCSSPNPQGWLMLTLKNTVCNMIRTRSSAQKLVEQYMVSQIKEVSVSEDRIDLRILYENVADSEEFKLLIELALEGKSHKEMADARGITVEACKKRVQRAKEKLQKKLKL